MRASLRLARYVVVDQIAESKVSFMSGIEVFQDMELSGPASNRAAVAAALIESAAHPWAFDKKGSDEADKGTFGHKGTLIFRRQRDGDLPAGRLVLLSRKEGYSVPNITPDEFGQLSIAQYNGLLKNFVESIAQPVARRFGYIVNITSAIQGLEDWMSKAAADALRNFSAATNKSTGASHPMDERRWFDFILAVHRGRDDVGPDRLRRWLHEVEGWTDEVAVELSGEFERSLALLTREAETR